MFLQKVRAFFEWLGKRSAAKSQKALDYEWTTMSSPGDVPVKTVDLGDEEAPQRPAPVKTVEIPEQKPAQAPAAAPAAAAEPSPAPVKPAADPEKKMTAILKMLTIRDAVAALQEEFKEAADVRRSRVGLLAFLRDNPQAVTFLEGKVKAAKAAKAKAKAKPAVKSAAKPVAKKPAAKKTAAKPAAAKGVKPAVKPAAKRPAKKAAPAAKAEPAAAPAPEAPAQEPKA